MPIKYENGMLLATMTEHTARLVELPPPLTGYSWQVSWLPGRHLTFNEAITAITLAQVVASRADANGEIADCQLFAHVHQWAAILGLTGHQAIIEVLKPNPVHV